MTPFLHLSNELAKRGHKISFSLPKKALILLEDLNLQPGLITFHAVAALPPGSETASEIPISDTPSLAAAMDLTRPPVGGLAAGHAARLRLLRRENACFSRRKAPNRFTMQPKSLDVDGREFGSGWLTLMQKMSFEHVFNGILCFRTHFCICQAIFSDFGISDEPARTLRADTEFALSLGLVNQSRPSLRHHERDKYDDMMTSSSRFVTARDTIPYAVATLLPL